MRILCQIMRWQHAVSNSLLKIEVRDFCAHEGVQINRIGTPSQRVVSFPLQFSCTGATKYEHIIFFRHKPMHFIQELGHFRNLINNDQRVLWFVTHHFVEKGGMARHTRFHACVQQIYVNAVGKLLPKNGAFSRLARTKQEDTFLQSVFVNLANSLIHKQRLIIQSDASLWAYLQQYIANLYCAFSLKILSSTAHFP